MLFVHTVNVSVKADDINIPVIEVYCTENISDFLQEICNDIYKKSSEKFVPNDSPVAHGYHGVVYQLKGEKEDLCVKIFKADIKNLRTCDIEEHKYYYKITGTKYSENFLANIKNPKTSNISLPVAAYKSKKFFGNISKFGGFVQLSKITKNIEVLSEEKTKTIIYDILNGQKSLHSTKNGEVYCHCDLSPYNIVLHCPDNEDLEANIVDAGTIRKNSINKVWNFITLITGYRIWNYINLLTGCRIWTYINVDTGYHDPEDLNYERVDEKSDIFATGVIMWELLFGNCPFAGCNLGKISKSKAIIKLDKSLQWLRDNENISKNCKDLLLKLLSPKKCDRISSSDALKHDFFKNSKISNLEKIIKKAA